MGARATGRKRGGRNSSCLGENRNDLPSLAGLTRHWPYQVMRTIDPRWKERFHKASTQATEVPAWGQIEDVLSLAGKRMKMSGEQKD